MIEEIGHVPDRMLKELRKICLYERKYRKFTENTTFLQHKPTITRAAVCKWSIEQVGAMLRLNHLGQYARAFQQKGINGGLLIQLKESIGQPGELITSALDIERLQSAITFYVT